MKTLPHLTSPYGTYCPVCTGPIIDRQRSPNGASICGLGHKSPPGTLLTLDQSANQRFSKDCGDKLRGAAHHKGRGGWENPDQVSDTQLASMLLEHLRKGDMRDVANFCMFLHERQAEAGAIFRTLLPDSHIPDLEAGPASIKTATAVIYAETDCVGSRREEEIEVDLTAWDLASDSHRENWARQYVGNLMSWGVHLKEEDRDA